MNAAEIKNIHICRELKFPYAWKFDDIVAKLDAAVDKAFLSSTSKGTAICTWQVVLQKKSKPNVVTAGQDKENNYDVGVFLVRKATEAGVCADATYDLHYVDFSTMDSDLSPECRSVGKHHTKKSHRGKQSVWTEFGIVFDRSKLLQKLNSAGALVVRAAISLDFYKAAFGFAEHAHSVRTRALVKRKYGEDSQRSIEFRSSALPVVDNDIATPKVVAWQSLMVEASPVFRAMFVDHPDSQECQTGVVIIDDFSLEIVKLMVDFIDNGPDAVQVSISGSDLYQLAKLADKYDVKDLSEFCLAMLLESVTLENALNLYGLGHLLNIKAPKSECIRTIKDKQSVNEHGEFWKRALTIYGKSAMLPHAMSDFIQLMAQSEDCDEDSDSFSEDSD